MIKIKTSKSENLTQGDILKDITIMTALSKDENIDFEEITLPFGVIVSQSCDLERHYENINKNNDKQLLEVVILPMYTLADFRAGNHLSGFGKTARFFEKNEFDSEMDKIRKYEKPRFHLLEFSDSDKLINQLPDDFILDFRHYISIDYDILNKCIKVASIDILFREQLTSRFAGNFSRIGVPS